MKAVLTGLSLLVAVGVAQADNTADRAPAALRKAAKAKVSTVSAAAAGPKAKTKAKDGSDSSAVSRSRDKAAGAPSINAGAPVSTTTVATAAPAAAPKKLGFHWLMWNERLVSPDVNYGLDGDVGVYDMSALQSFRINYKLTPVVSTRLAVEATHNWGAGSTEGSDFTLLDPYVQVAHSSLLKLPAAIGVKGFARFYPALTQANATNTYGVARGGLTIAKKLGPVEISLENDSRVYFQRDLSRAKKAGVEVGAGNPLAPTKLARTMNYLGVSATIAGPVSAYQNVGSERHFYNEDNGLKRNSQEFFYAETGVDVALNDNVSLTVGVVTDDDRDLLNQSDDFSTNRVLGLYRDIETSAFIMTNVVF